MTSPGLGWAAGCQGQPSSATEAVLTAPPGSLENRLPQGGPGTQPSRRPPHWGRCRRGRGSCRPMGLAPHKLMLRAGKGPSEARAVGDPESHVVRGGGHDSPGLALLCSPPQALNLWALCTVGPAGNTLGLCWVTHGVKGQRSGEKRGPRAPGLCSLRARRGHQEGFREVSGVQGVRQRGGLGAPSQWAAGPVGWPRGKEGVWPGVWKRPQLERVSGSCAGVPWVPGHKGQCAVTDAQAPPFWGRRSWGPGCAGLTSQLAGPLSHPATVLPALGGCPGTLGGVEAAPVSCPCHPALPVLARSVIGGFPGEQGSCREDSRELGVPGPCPALPL